SEAEKARQMAFHTLREMAKGGMYDHLGGGFHRYSVDARWHVPHFEKMLYDQAQLVSAYVEAYQISGDEAFAEVAHDILRYVLRDMTSPAGGFYSAEDADSYPEEGASKKTEGAFYVWSEEELHLALNSDQFKVVRERYGVGERGNVDAASDPHGELAGKNVFYVKTSIAEVAKRLDKREQEVREILEASNELLFNRRETRPKPHLDDKIITSWNGLMISTLAKAGSVLDRPEYIKAAREAVAFVNENLYDEKNKRLYRSYRTSRSDISGFVDDYASFIAGLLDLYEATGELGLLVQARELQESQDEKFWDKEAGGYFGVSLGRDPVLFRMKEDYDGAEPSPNSISIENLIRLGDMFKDASQRARAEDALLAFGDQLKNLGFGAPRMLAAMDWSQQAPSQVVFSGTIDSEPSKNLRKEIFDHFDPYQVVVYALDEGSLPGPKKVWGSFTLFSNDTNQAAVCRDFVCLQPTSDPEVLRSQLRGNVP
ncbi:MAG: thioredoxin domain-containing protein, partial [Verrucomicrobiota bacterium]